MIEVKELRKSFNKGKAKVEIVKGIEFKVPEQDFLLILGHNGCGKSTLLKMMCGVVKSSEGGIYYDGLEVFKNRKAIVKNMGVVFNQKPSFLVDVSVKDNMEYFRAIYKIEKNEFEKTLKQIDKYIGIEELYDKQYRRLSFGQRIKCEIASVLIHKPKYILLDEPTIGLDLDAKKGLFELLDIYRKENGSTVVVITHDFEHIDNICNHIIVLKSGEVIYDDTMENLRDVINNTNVLEIKYSEIINQGNFDELIKDALVNSIEEKRIQIDISSLEYNIVIKKVADAVDILTLSKENKISFKGLMNNEL